MHDQKWRQRRLADIGCDGSLARLLRIFFNRNAAQQLSGDGIGTRMILGLQLIRHTEQIYRAVKIDHPFDCGQKSFAVFQWKRPCRFTDRCQGR